MGAIVHRNQECWFCPSSDAVQVYEDGGAKCFSCGKAFNYQKEYEKRNGKGSVPTFQEDNYRRKHKAYELDDYIALPCRGWKERLITRQAAEFFGVRASFNEEGEIDNFYFPFSNKNLDPVIVGFKRRNPNQKDDMSVLGEAKTIFGLEHFKNGGQRIVITEGEVDTLSIAVTSLHKWNQIYPVCSMGGAQQTSFLVRNREILRNYKEIVLWFDNDEQGQKAVKEAAKILGSDKVKVVNSNEKDANDVLVKYGLEQGSKRIWNYIYDAQRYTPAGIVAGEDTWDKYQEFQNLEYIPWPPFLNRLGELTFGRALGTITMLAAGTSIGKSSLLREDIYHILKTTDYKVGACFLEEDIGETVEGIMGLHLNKRLGLPTTESSTEERRKAWEETVGLPERTLFVDHQGSISDNSLIEKLEYLMIQGCKLVYLDHITIAVSETEGDSVNAAIDKFMSDLLKLVKRHGAWVCVVSHLRKVKSGEQSFETGAPISEDDLKGSGSLKQISFQTLAISRNKLAENEEQRHKSTIWLLKDRKTGNTGMAGAYKFDRETGRLLEVEAKDPDEFEIEIVE